MQTHQTRTRYIAIALSAILLIACSQGQITKSLEVAISATEVAISILSTQTQINPAVLKVVTTYLGHANEALSAVTAILASTDSAAVQSAKIVAVLSAIPRAELPPGTPQTIVIAINEVANAVAKLLGSFQPTVPFAKAAGAPTLAVPIKLSSGDRKALQAAKTKLLQNEFALEQAQRR